MAARKPSRQSPQPPPPAPPRISPLPFAGLIGLVCVLLLDLGTAGVLPWWATALLVVVWACLSGLAVLWWKEHPRRVPWLAGVGLVVWVVIVVAVNLLSGR